MHYNVKKNGFQKFGWLNALGGDQLLYLLKCISIIITTLVKTLVFSISFGFIDKKMISKNDFIDESDIA